MALQLGALREALIDAGASEEKAKAAAEELAGYDSRLASIDARLHGIDSRLSMLTWVSGILFAVVLTSQALIWTAQGRIDGQLAAMTTTLAHVEQLVAKP